MLCYELDFNFNAVIVHKFEHTHDTPPHAKWMDIWLTLSGVPDMKIWNFNIQK